MQNVGYVACVFTLRVPLFHDFTSFFSFFIFNSRCVVWMMVENFFVQVLQRGSVKERNKEILSGKQVHDFAV